MIAELQELQNEYVVNNDETKILFLKIIEQSIRDYTNLAKSSVPIENQYFNTAEGFLFDDDFYICWGDYQICLEEILDYLHIDHDWFLRKLELLV